MKTRLRNGLRLCARSQKPEARSILGNAVEAAIARVKQKVARQTGRPFVECNKVYWNVPSRVWSQQIFE